MKKNQNENPVEKSPDRIKVLEKIQQFELEGKFDVDPEDDPPTVILKPDDVDYLQEKFSTRFYKWIANGMGWVFLHKIIRKNNLIIKDVIGIENMDKVDSGAIITCNHFNPFDSFTIETVFRMSKQAKHKNLYKVIREGNFTNFPGLYGFFFRHCDTLPLSSDPATMKKFLFSVDTLLKRGNYILIYPEQSMWWNYKKPKPLKNGAFKFAVKSNVPVLPIFITMEDSSVIGDDGFNVQEYTVHIGEPIYPDSSKSSKENIKDMRNKNYQVWKDVYEDFYKTPLTYTTKDPEKLLMND